ALDTYIHHVGSRTFAALGIDTEKQLAQNLGLFRDKWGAERASAYRMMTARATPAQWRPAAPSDGRVRISLCMIVRNEEENLPACLDSVEGIFSEIVIVDTGSTDRTRELAQARGATVVEFLWCDDFAAARNVSIEHATGDYIFWMD